MIQPLISVLIPVYNTEPYLRESLDSVLGQTYRNFEIIVVDDGSTDKSPDICTEYAAADSRIRVIHQPNGGVSAARKTGLDAAAGEYIAWVDSDDVCAPDMLEYLYKGLAEYSADMVQGSLCISRRGFDAAQARPTTGAVAVKTSVREYCQALQSSEILHLLTCKLYKAEVFQERRIPNLNLGEDAYMQYMLAPVIKRAVLLPGIKYYYRQRAGSIMHTYTLQDHIEYKKALSEIFESDDLDVPPNNKDFYDYISSHQLALCLSRTDLQCQEVQDHIEIFLSELRENKPRLLACPLIGRLGRFEIRILCLGKPFSWKFSALCQKIFAWKADWKITSR